MTIAARPRTAMKRAASASAKPIAAEPSAGLAGAISCSPSAASPPPSARSSAPVSGSLVTARCSAASRRPSIVATARLRLATPSALSPRDIRHMPR